MKCPGVEIANLESSHLLGTWANHFISMSFSSTDKWKQLIEIHCENHFNKSMQKKNGMSVKRAKQCLYL